MITVYTCATNGRDELRGDQDFRSASFVAYVDKENIAVTGWELRKAVGHFRSARRNSRMHKILSHQFVDTEYSVWMDANVSLLVPAQQLVDEYLRSTDLAVFKHRTRTCAYEEAMRCSELNLDSKAAIEFQMQRYREDKFEPNSGLAEATVVIRRHTQGIRNFNNAWWSELCRHSVRDQLSFVYAAKITGTKVNYITPTKYLNPYFSIVNRPAGVEPSSSQPT